MTDENAPKPQIPQTPVINADEDPDNAQWLRMLGADHAQPTQQQLRHRKEKPDYGRQQQPQ